jgi:SAM-dependent methyltransferase
VTTDFNRYKEDYKEQVDKSIRFSGQTVEFFTEIKAQLIVQLSKILQIDSQRLIVLDLGCGQGLTDMFLVNEFHMLHGVDIAHSAVEKARMLNPSVVYKVYDGFKLPYEENTFDIVFTICVMHHLKVTERKNFISEMKRVTKEQGLIIIFEHNPINCFTRHAVSQCEFDRDAILISKTELKNILFEDGLSICKESYILFFPLRGKLFRFIERGLKRLPIGAQYYLVADKNHLHGRY